MTTTTTTRLQRRNYGRGHGYKLDGEKIIGVTTALDVLDKPALRNWFAAEAAKRAVDEWDRLTELPISERLEYIKSGPRDKVRAAALRGTEIHGLGEKLASGEEVDVPAEHLGPVEAYVRWLDRWDVTPIATETPLCHTVHRYGGTADLWARVGKLDSALCLIDVKTGKGIYSETGLQLAAYRHSDLMQPEKDAEIKTPDVYASFVAHVLPDDVRMIPVSTGPAVFRQFLYVLAVKRGVLGWEEWPLVGSAIQPGEAWKPDDHG